METKKKFHPYSVTSLVMGLLCIIPAINTIFSVLAIIFGIISLREIPHHPGYKGRGLSIAGITIGVVVLIATIIYFVDPKLLGLNPESLAYR